MWTVALVVGVYVARYAFARLLTLQVRGQEARRAAVARLRGRMLRAAFGRLGATFIKLGQVLSTRRDLLDPELIDELRQLQDRLPPFPLDHVERVVREDLGGGIQDHFAEFDPVPVAAASVAQVHRGRLPDGREVAVKVLRPDVRALTENDARIAVGWARVLSVLPAVGQSDLVGHLRELFTAITAQTDLRLEAANYVKFRANFAGTAGVRFPEVHAGLSSERLLTMEFIRGRKIDALDPTADHSVLVGRLRNCLLKMMFEDGFLHADLHPGNFVVTDADELAVFDVGLVKEIDDDQLVQYIDWNRCLVMGSAEDQIRHMRRYYLKDREDIDWEAMGRDIGEFTSAFRGKSLKDIELGDLVNRAFAVGRKYGARPSPEFALFMVGVITAEGVGKQLEPDSDSLGQIAEYIAPILARRGMLGAQP